MLTSDIDVDRSIVTFRNEDGKTELTISTAPLSTVEATPAAHLIRRSSHRLPTQTATFTLISRTSFPSARPRPYASYGSMPEMIRARHSRTRSPRKGSTRHAAIGR